MVKEALCEQVVEVRTASDGVMTVVIVLLRGCAEVGVWACSAMGMTFGRKTVFL